MGFHPCLTQKLTINRIIVQIAYEYQINDVIKSNLLAPNVYENLMVQESHLFGYFKCRQCLNIFLARRLQSQWFLFVPIIIYLFIYLLDDLSFDGDKMYANLPLAALKDFVI